MASVDNGELEAPPPPPPAAVNVWEPSEGQTVHYLIRSPWQWVMREIKKKPMVEVESAQQLPSSKLVGAAATSAGIDTPSSTPSTRRRRQKGIKDKINGPSALKIEVSHDETGEILFAVHGTSSALDGLEDKDELVRTIQRCRCEQLNLSPPSYLINWDVTREECFNVVGNALPTLESNTSKEIFAVLKEPMGSQGSGIFFVKDAEEIHRIIDEHRQRALEEPHFLDNLIAAKGRIPSWVLQAEVAPPMLILGGRKFHVRTYIVVVEQPHLPELLEVFIYNRHELRVAGVPIEQEPAERDPQAHITNAARSSTTDRILLDDLPELTDRGLKEKLDIFVAETFAEHLFPDIQRRVGYSLSQDSDDNSIGKFVVAGLDLMVTEGDRIFLLEANVHPAAPPPDSVNEKFRDHLKGFVHDLVDLAVGRPSPNFQSADDVIARRDAKSSPPR